MNIYEKIAELNRKNQPFVLAAIVKTAGSVPGKTGFKILVKEDGTSSGTVGGGELEKRVLEECSSRLEEGESGLQEYVLRERDTGKEKIGNAQIIPMMCNGKVWIYYDVVKNRTPVYIFGGGHVGQALCYFLSKLDFQITVIDNREQFVGKEKNSYADKLILSEYVGFAREFTPLKNAFTVIMTQGHSYDYDVLRTLYERKLPLKYIGVIASRSKSAGLIKNLKKDFGEDVDTSHLYTPIGIDIGGNTESEIALSIAAEIQAIRFGKNVQHLRRLN